LPASKDAIAVSLAGQSLTALKGNLQIVDATLTGTVTRIVGSDVETGAVTLMALGGSSSKVNLSLSNETRVEVRNKPANTDPEGAWIDASGSRQAYATHNCFTDAVWFLPTMSILSQVANPNLIVTYVGRETKAGVAVHHLHFAIQTTFPDPSGLFASLSAEDIYLDVATFLPVALTFNSHPDSDAGLNIPVEIDFDNYQVVSGVRIPFRIQKFLNRSLYLDIIVQSAVLNSGLNDSLFTWN
jgi:hypothetical protein